MTENKTALQDIIIDEEFKRLLPPLDGKTYLSLEQSILDYGCMNPLVLWNGVLIDGYNRYTILAKHDLPFNTVSLEFDSRDEVLIWIISTQVSRRNLTTMQLTYFRGLHYNTEKKLRGGDRYWQKNPKGQNVLLEGSTANRLSVQYKVNPKTIQRDGQIAAAIAAIGRASPDAKQDILSGEARISRKQLREMTADPEDKIAAIASEIAAGTFAPSGKPEDSKPTGANRQNRQNTSNKNETPSLSTEIITGANEFINNISQFTTNKNPNGMKKAIRSYINQLEEIYQQVI